MTHNTIHRQEIMGALARGYFVEENQTKIIDPDLIKAMVKEVESLIATAVQRVREGVMSEVVERLKNGVAYGEFGFSRTDEGKDYGKVAINLDDIIKSLTNTTQ